MFEPAEFDKEKNKVQSEINVDGERSGEQTEIKNGRKLLTVQAIKIKEISF